MSPILSFSATIDIIGVNPYVHLPQQILKGVFEQADKDKGPIPVRGTLNGAAYTQTLVKYEGAWRLYLNGMMLKKAAISFPSGKIQSVAGTTVQLTIAFDPEPRTIPMHPRLNKALLNDKEANNIYHSLPAHRKKEILRYLASLKTDESIIRNVERILAHLKGLPTDGLHALMRKNK